MLNFNPELTHDKALAGNQRSIARHIDDDHYVRDFSPGDFVLDGVATHVLITVASPQWPAVKFPDGLISAGSVSWRKPSEWRAGKLRLQFRYTSDTAGTSNFDLRYRVLAIRDSEVHPGTLLTANPALLALAGPAVANAHIRSAYLYTTISFDGDDEMFSLQLFRDGAGDANNNSFHLLGVEVLHIPAVQESS